MTRNVRETIETANRQAVDQITAAMPAIIDVAPARDAIAEFPDNLILHAGPPIEPCHAVAPLRTAISGAAIHAGMARDLDDAWKKVEAGEIRLAPAQDHHCACGALAPITTSTRVLVAREEGTGVVACCSLQEGPANNALRWGVYSPSVEGHLKWMDDVLAPVLSAALRSMGGLNLRNIVARATGMGDENHSRQLASNLLALTEMLPAIMDADVPEGDRVAAIKFLAKAERFFLHMLIAGAASVMESVRDIPFCTLLVAMGGNGHEFGTKFSATGDAWFTVPAPKVLGMFINPTYTEADVVPYLGDSCIIEVYGFGGLAAAAGPAAVRLAGGDFREAVRRTEEAREVCLGSHDWAPIPWLDFRGPPAGIDMRRVAATGITPTSHGGTAHFKGGQAGAGACSLPIECFTKGLRAFAERYGVG
ncbi:MAG: DUF1116 domain-containing protein [Rhodospirillales bacterium]|jgi:hypothetical protein|nr:DUF1116 domain-containing protein [Rhodospirillales bacterium]